VKILDANGHALKQGDTVVIRGMVKRMDGSGVCLVETLEPMSMRTQHYPSIVLKASQVEKVAQSSTLHMGRAQREDYQ
jgi:uncharacterized Zn ribbon protein